MTTKTYRNTTFLFFVATVAFLFGFFSEAFSEKFGVTPKRTSPGHICTPEDRDFEKMRYEGKVAYCKRKVSDYQKTKIYEAYKVPPSQRSNYTIDHIIPLAIGGSNNDKNLWPEHKELKKCRQKFEMRMYRAVATGRLTQAQAVHEVMRVKFLDPCNRL